MTSLAAIDRSEIPRIKWKKSRIEALRQEYASRFPAEPWEKIVIEKKDGCFIASGGQHTATDVDPEAAMRRLLVKLRVGLNDEEEYNRRKALYRSMPGTTCEIHDMHTKADLDGDLEVVVRFTTNARLCRGELEQMFSAAVRATHGVYDGDDDA